MVLIAGLVAFVSALGYLMASSLATRDALEFDATPAGPRAARATAAGDAATSEDTLTIDARTGNEWRFASLSRGLVRERGDSSGWEIAVRRHRIIAHGMLADLGVVPYAQVRHAPANGFAHNTLGRDSTNAATHHWYRYGMLSHLLEPNGHVFALRTQDSRYFKFEVLSYYCRGLEAGCLTIRFAPIAPPESSAARLAPAS